MRGARERAARSVARYLALGVGPDDDEAERFRKRTATAVVTLITIASVPNAATFLSLGQPLAATAQVAVVLLSIASLAHLFATKSGYVFLRVTMVLGFLAPIALMWSLGGFAQGGAVILWSFSMPLAALVFWGARAALLWFAACMAALLVSAILESTLTAMVDPLPSSAQTVLFVFVVGSNAAVNLSLLLYFVHQRNVAMARSESLLRNVLPGTIADRLKAKQTDLADRYEAASVLFVDIVNFTTFAERTPAERVVALLGKAFATLDDLADRHGIEKIKTLGDGYLAVAGVPIPRPDHAAAAAGMALDVRPALRNALKVEWPDLEVRVGIASGALVAGVIGRRRFSYDVWGDTVNTASRMASIAAPGDIVVTAESAAVLDDGFLVEPLPDVAVKGKGVLRPYRLVGSVSSA